MKHNVLLVGSGGRIQNNFIPALRYLSHLFDISGVYSRSAGKREAVGARWGIPVVKDLATADLSQVNVVVISVTTSAVPGLLQVLAPRASQLILLIDTPVFDRLKDFRHIHFLKKFKRVLVAEDFMNFPQFELLRTAVDDGLVGDLKAVRLFHTGYLHHGTALIRSFFHFKHAALTRKKRQGDGTVHVSYSLGTSQGLMIEPYRRLDGRIEVIGSKAMITTDNDATGDEKVIKLTEVKENGVLTGYEIITSHYSKRYVPAALPFLRKFDLDHRDDFNLLKTCGLIRIFEAIVETNINSTYDFKEGCYDSIVGRLSVRAPMLIDPFGKTIVGLLSVASR